MPTTVIRKLTPLPTPQRRTLHSISIDALDRRALQTRIRRERRRSRRSRRIVSVETRLWEIQLAHSAVEMADTAQAVAVRWESVHFLFDREDLFAGTGAFGLRHCGLQQVEEVVVFFLAEGVEKFFCG